MTELLVTDIIEELSESGFVPLKLFLYGRSLRDSAVLAVKDRFTFGPGEVARLLLHLYLAVVFLLRRRLLQRAEGHSITSECASYI